MSTTSFICATKMVATRAVAWTSDTQGRWTGGGGGGQRQGPVSDGGTSLPIGLTAAGGDVFNPADPVPFVDKNGDPILDIEAKPMLRPAGLEPQMFVAAGQRVADTAMLDKETAAALDVYFSSQFRQGGAWDAQRVGGAFNKDFVAYATVAIGMYDAAAGHSLDSSLSVQDVYARLFSKFGDEQHMDQTYTHLRAANVWNTKLGYKLVETGRIAR